MPAHRAADIHGEEATEHGTLQALPWGGHPNGMYMASAIERALGKARLLAVSDPFSFLLTYDEAEEELGLARFSSRSISYVTTLREALVDPAL